MKNIYIILYTLYTFFLLGNPLNSICQGSWEIQYPSSLINDLNSIFFINDNEAWIVGSNGLILHTIDSGSSWKQVNSGTQNSLLSIYFVDSKNGWISGSKGIILNTSNGGEIWNLQNSGVSVSLYDIEFITKEIGFAISSNIILKTNNGGKNWEKIWTGKSNDIFSGMCFVDQNEGWVVGHWTFPAFNYRLILHTTNGGTSWNEAPYSTGALSDVHFLNKNVGYSVGYGMRVISTKNGGVSWSSKSLGEENWWLNSLHFIDLNNGWVIGGGKAFQTRNGGITWTKVNLPNESGSDVMFNNSNHGIIVGNDGIIIQTKDGGQTWFSNRYDSLSMKDVSFIDKNTGWVIANVYLGNYIYHTKVLKTTDGGKNWTFLNVEIPSKMNEIHFVSDSVGWAAGNGVYKTSDGGNNWYQKLNEQVQAASFLDNENAWIVGRPKILRTYNGGNNWINQYTPGGNKDHYRDIFFIDKYVGWIISPQYSLLARDVKIYRTMNGGSNWKEVSSVPYHNYSSIYFLNKNIGWLFGDNYSDWDDGVLVKTFNGSSSSERNISWVEYKFKGKYNNIEEFEFLETNKGWGIGPTQQIIYTKNGGRNWQFQENPANTSTFWGIDFVDINNGWAVGGQYNSSVILKYTDTLKTRVDMVNNIPKELELFQNFPNPFNISTTITYNLNNPSQVEFNIYNILGQKVYSLIQNNTYSGKNFIKWNGSDHSGVLVNSGVYIYQIKTKYFEKCCKMLYLK